MVGGSRDVGPGSGLDASVEAHRHTTRVGDERPHARRLLPHSPRICSAGTAISRDNPPWTAEAAAAVVTAVAASPATHPPGDGREAQTAAGEHKAGVDGWSRTKHSVCSEEAFQEGTCSKQSTRGQLFHGNHPVPRLDRFDAGRCLSWIFDYLEFSRHLLVWGPLAIVVLFFVLPPSNREKGSG